MATKKDYQKKLKEWKAYLRQVNRFVIKMEKYVKSLPPGTLSTEDEDGGLETPPPPPNP